MRPFLFLGIRAEDAAADDEYAAVLRCAGLDESMLVRHRLEAEPLKARVDVADLDRWSGIILGGGPFTMSDPPETKGPEQRRAEEELAALLDCVVPADFPFLGACYGIGVLGTYIGGVVDETFAEPIGAVSISVSAAGREDPLFSVLPAQFDAFVGHKEAATTLPERATVLASSPTCPVQGFRVGRHVYATQFHPELDLHGLQTRIEAYRDHGYFHPDEAADLIRRAAMAHVEHPPAVLRRFVDLYIR